VQNATKYSNSNGRTPSHPEDLAAKRTSSKSESHTGGRNVASKSKGGHSSKLAKSSPKQRKARKTPVGEPVQKEPATTSSEVERSASVLREDHPVEIPGPTESIPYRLQPGKLFASFELLHELEIGSSGALWLAQEYNVRREAAQVELKFLPDLIVNDKTAVEELKNEIRRRITLRHPNISRVYGVVEHKGKVAIQIEYLDGQSLSRLRSARPNQVFEVRDLAIWVTELCGALEYAHKDGGLIGGDIVPRNLIVNAAGKLKLKDFGIANCISDSLSRLTGINDSSETLPFQSLQRAAGQEPAITDDVYSLGATIYELLTSKPPFYAGDIGAQLNGEIPPSMTARRAELGIEGAAIPKNWEETVAACLAKDPVNRPKSALEVAERLKSAADTSGVPPAATAKSSPPVRSSFIRRPWLVKVGILFFLAIVGVIALLSFHWLTEPHAGKIVEYLSLTPTVAPTPSESSAQESSLASATPSPAVSSAPTQEISPTPTIEVSQTPNIEVNPTPIPGVNPTPIPEVSPTPSLGDGTAPDERQFASPSPTPLSQPDNDATKEDVIKRINALPGVTNEKKANLIANMQKARSMERLTVIPFDVGQTTLRKAAIDELVKAFDRPEMNDKLSDPTTVLVVAGYADIGGRAGTNLRISQERADAVSKILKEQVKLLNAMQTIGMGGTEILDSKRPDQNRVVEVWAVVPKLGY
jgi:serine/threonine protein kinase